MSWSRLIGVIAFLACWPAVAYGQSYSGSGGSVPDGGGTGSQFSSTINVPDSFLIGDVTVSLDSWEHTWQGDVWARILGPNGQTIDLMRRPGQGTDSTFGSQAVFLAANDYLWSDAGSASTSSFASGDIPSGTYRASTNPGANTGGGSGTTAGDVFESFVTKFGGANAQGNWTLTISDFATPDPGALTGWTLNFTAVPEPASLGLLALAAPALLIRRRR